jgi:hypothetical protein
MWRLQIAMILLTRALKTESEALAELDLDDDVKLAMVILDRCLRKAKAAGKLIDLAEADDVASVQADPQEVA